MWHSCHHLKKPVLDTEKVNLFFKVKLAPTKFCLTRKKMLYFKDGRHKNNSVWLAMCIGVLALIWYFMCEKRVWHNKVLDIWLTLDHIRNVALLKSHTRLRLSRRCQYGSSSIRTVFYLSNRMKSIPPSAYCFGVNPKLMGSFSDALPCIQQPATLPLIWWGTHPMCSKGKVTLMQPSKTTLNLPSWSLHLCSPLKEIRRVKIHHQFTSFPK